MRKWTESEDEILRRYYLTKPRNWSEWEKLLPGRSADSRTDRALRLGMRRGKNGPASRVSDEEIIKAIDDYWADCGFAPCVRDVMDAVGFQSPSTIKYRLDELVKAGKITREKKIPRSLRVVR